MRDGFIIKMGHMVSSTLDQRLLGIEQEFEYIFNFLVLFIFHLIYISNFLNIKFKFYIVLGSQKIYI